MGTIGTVGGSIGGYVEKQGEGRKSLEEDEGRREKERETREESLRGTRTRDAYCDVTRSIVTS